MKQKSNKMMHAIKHCLKDNMGSSMVLVIVAIAFVAILGAAIMWMSLNNYMMKVTDARQKESFYSAETVMEQIVAGLQEDASAAVADSYTKVLQKYSNSTDAQRLYEFQLEYFLALQKKLEDSSDPHKYNMVKLIEYVDPDLLDEAATGHTRELTGLNGCVMESVGAGAGAVPTNIVLKDIHLVFEDDRGYTSIINTDITIGVPAIDFTQSASVPDIFSYCLVADRSLTGKEGTGLVTINGSVYGGSGYTEEEIAADATKENKNGITVNDKWKLQKADKIVTDRDITLTNATAELTVGGADTEDVPMLWAENLNVENGKLKLHAKTYIADDLMIGGTGSTVTLEKYYYGYGNSLTDTAASSAIVINGLNTTLNMQKLEELLLAGHAYIGTASAAPGVATVPGADGQPDYVVENKNILMGESIAVKGNQIAYLVPDECIGVLDGETVMGKNPMTSKEYTALLTEAAKYQNDPDHTFSEVSYTKTVSALGGAPLGAYASAYKTIFCPSNGETLVYYYIVMDEDNANRYFMNYYGMKKEKLNRYLSIYTSDAGIQANTDFVRINTQGNWMQAQTAGDVVTSQLNPAVKEDAVDLTTENEHYTKVFEALKAKLILSDNVTDDEKKNGVFTNLINIEAMENFTAANGGAVEFTTAADEAGKTYRAIITNDDFHYTGNGTQKDIRLIVSLKDVTVSGDFTGLIMAKGDITVDAGVTITSAGEAASASSTGRDELTRVLQCKYTETIETRPIDMFLNSSKYVLDGTVVGTDDTADVLNPIVFQELVRYQNWIKQ